MNKFALLAVLAVLTSTPLTAAETEQRSVQLAGGQMTLAVPRSWPAIETHQTSRGGVFYHLGPSNTNFYFNLYLNDPLQTRTNTLVDSGLERFLESSLSSVAKNSVEGKVQPHRFGAQKDGVYARFTDR